MRRRAWLVSVMLVAAAGGCGDGDEAEDSAPGGASPAAGHREASAADSTVRDSAASYDPRQTQVFRCTAPSGESFRFEVRPRDGRVELWLPGRFDRRTVVLGRVRAASGARYEGRGVVFWNRGDEALLGAGGREFRGCTMDRGGWVWAAARRRGVDFRASGNEPGWYLELSRGDSLRLEYDYGEDELTVATPDPSGEPSGGGVRYRAETGEHVLTVTIADEPCTAMSGTGFPKTVTVDLDGTSYRGCGRWLDVDGG